MTKNPFSLYDFLGYLYPGLVSIVLIGFFLNREPDYVLTDYFKLTNISEYCIKKLNISSWETGVLICVASYLVGHVVSYLSSVIVEKFAIRLYGYPSKYLLKEEHPLAKRYGIFTQVKREFQARKNCMGDNNFLPWCAFIARLLWLGAVCFLLAPISILLLFDMVSFKSFLTAPLDVYTRNAIKQKCNELSENLHLPKVGINEDVDYHRIVMHYVYIREKEAQRKTDNYVALYGFLRTMTLISSVFTVTMWIKAISTIDFSQSFDSEAFLYIFILMPFISMVLFLAFMKFYRRFTLENYMALLVCVNKKEDGRDCVK